MVQSFSVSTDLFKLEDQAECTVLHPTFVEQFGWECSWIAIFNAGWVFKASSTTEGKYSNPNSTPGHFLSPARLLVCDFNWKKLISNAVQLCWFHFCIHFQFLSTYLKHKNLRINACSYGSFVPKKQGHLLLLVHTSNNFHFVWL